jgi:hypothetical protein
MHRGPFTAMRGQPVVCLLRSAGAGSNGVGLFDRHHEDASIAPFTGASRLQDNSNDVIDFVIRDDDVNHHLWQVSNLVVGAAPGSLRIVLPSVSSDVRHGHARQIDPSKRIRRLFDLVFPDNAFDQFHGFPHYVRSQFAELG